ncbi:MAG: glycosyltransferase family 4 protein [Bacteroidales bacterium]|nr:glycosyltransferase family 4 protein [Bacteroidales bacterium]
MARIALISNRDNNFYNFRSELILKLVELGHDVNLVCPYGKKIDYFTQRGCKFWDIDLDRRGKNAFKDAKLILAYRKLLKELKPNVVLTYTTKSSVYGGMVCRWLKIPYIVNNAGLVENNNKLLEFILRILYRTGFKGASCMMYQNGRERDYVNELLKNKVHYRDIPGSGVNLDTFAYQPYPVDDNPIRFNFVGRIVGFKGIGEFLECAKRIKAKYPNTEFVIYGSFVDDDGGYKDQIVKLEKNGIVKYGGVQLDMKPYIAKAHAVIHSSYYEGMTNVILEHAAMGRPAIASDIPGCREGIDEGVSGYTFELKNVDSLVEKIEKFISLSLEEKVEMGQAARAKMEREFDRDIVTNVYVEEIRRLLG